MSAPIQPNNSASETVQLLEQLKLPDGFASAGGGVKQPLKPSYGKLSKHRFSRVHPGEDFKWPALIVTLKESGGNGESFIAIPALRSRLGSLASPKVLRLAVDNAGTPRLVGVPIIDPNGRPNSWNDSLVRAVQIAESQWVRIESNNAATQYEVIVAKEDLGAPQWPNQSMQELVLACFDGKIIQSVDHPVIRDLEGRL